MYKSLSSLNQTLSIQKSLLAAHAHKIDFQNHLSTIFLYLNDRANPMEISYSELRQNLKKAIDKATSTHEPFFITSHKSRKAVLISYDDYESLVETAYLLQNPVMAKRLLDAVVDAKKGKVSSHRIIDEK